MDFAFFFMLSPAGHTESSNSPSVSLSSSEELHKKEAKKFETFLQAGTYYSRNRQGKLKLRGREKKREYFTQDRTVGLEQTTDIVCDKLDLLSKSRTNSRIYLVVDSVV